MTPQTLRSQSDRRKRLWTSLELVKTAADYLTEKGIEGARLDAELLLAHVLSCERVALYTHFDKPLEPGEVDAYREFVRRRTEHVPTKYLLGTCEFASLEFDVNPSVLIPRPETEFVVSAALELVDGLPEPVLIDVGTGAGNIAVALAMTLPSGRVFASDISSDALATAQRNVARHGLEARVTLLHGDLLDPHDPSLPADVIVSNPPYVARKEFEALQPEIRLHEPEIALVGGEDGLDVYRRLADTCGAHLKQDGFLVLEIGQGQREAVEAILCGGGRLDIEKIVNDYSDIERVVIAKHRTNGTGAP